MSHQKQITGLFIVVDGPDGSGKSSVAVPAIKTAFEAAGRECLVTKEPGSGDNPVCADIRKILLKPEYDGLIDDCAELLLFLADRAEHVAQVIVPALRSGKVVICDRFESSTYAYQSAGRRVSTEAEFLMLNNFATKGLQPDLAVWMDIAPEQGLERNRRETNKDDRFEKEKLEFHTRVRDGFRQFFENICRYPYVRFDGTKDRELLKKEIVAALNNKGLI